MAALRSLLEVYGAFDQVILESEDPAIAAKVDDFLPDASANPGWYGQLEAFFFGDDAKLVPSLPDAIRQIGEEADGGRVLTVPQQSRLAYALGALTTLQDFAAPLALPVFEGFGDALVTGLTVLRSLRPEDPEPEPPQGTEPPSGPSPSGGPAPSGTAPPQPVKRVAVRQLAVKKVAAKKAPAKKAAAKKAPVKKAAADAPVNETSERIKATVKADIGSFTENARSNFSSSHDFNRFRALAIKDHFLADKTQHVPMCRTSLATVDGYDAVVVDTACQSPDVSLSELKAIVNPFNWHENYDDFFCNMQPGGNLRTDGWGRVLETVGFCEVGVNSLKTALRYYPYDGKHGEARLDYDLDDPTPGLGDGQVRVDRGFINMWSTSTGHEPAKKGVRVRTRKVVHINGLLPYAQARLVCITGYGTASAEFLLGPAITTAVDARPPDPGDPAKPQPFKYLGPKTLGSNITQTATTTTKEPAVPDQQSDHFAPTAVRIWADTAKGLTDDYLNFAGKWTADGLTLTDVADYSTTVTGRLINAPLAFLQAMSGPRYPNQDSKDAGKGGAT
jgi:hypothetical protein